MTAVMPWMDGVINFLSSLKIGSPNALPLKKEAFLFGRYYSISYFVLNLPHESTK